jgi:hypothetical protein
MDHGDAVRQDCSTLAGRRLSIGGTWRSAAVSRVPTRHQASFRFPTRSDQAHMRWADDQGRGPCGRFAARCEQMCADGFTNVADFLVALEQHTRAVTGGVVYCDFAICDSLQMRRQALVGGKHIGEIRIATRLRRRDFERVQQGGLGWHLEDRSYRHARRLLRLPDCQLACHSPAFIAIAIPRDSSPQSIS